MSVIGFILFSLFLWFFYNLFVKIILPVYKTTSHLKRQFKNMAQQREAQNNTTAPRQNEPVKEKVGEYIDFEEVKWKKLVAGYWLQVSGEYWVLHIECSDILYKAVKYSISNFQYINIQSW